MCLDEVKSLASLGESLGMRSGESLGMRSGESRNEIGRVWE